MAMQGWKLGAGVITLMTLAAAGAAEVAAQRQPPEQKGAQPATLAPHRAVYEFTLGKARSEKGVTSLSGRMVYEFTGSACEGYSQSMRFVTRTSGASGTVSVSDQRTTSWEDETGMRYRFQTSQFRDQKLIEQTAGTATRGEGQADTRVEITHPDKRSTAVGAGALFPIQHSIRLLDAARRARSSFISDFYDGSEGGEKTYVVNAQIGKPMPSSFNRSLPRVEQAEKLDGIQAWPVMLSYYEHGSETKDAVPSYEMGFVIFANGVSRRLVIDNGEYTMKGEMTQFALLDPTPCRK